MTCRERGEPLGGREAHARPYTVPTDLATGRPVPQLVWQR
ncbi:hypothetical protein ABID94_003216 [Streptomyces sp. PvR018]